MPRDIRYQGAIIRNDHILLIMHCHRATGRSYWVIPGGGREEGETEEACVQREMLEETGLQVSVECLLLDEAGDPSGIYQRLKTYLCKAAAGEPRPGYEPEPEAAQQYAITEVGWFDLRDRSGWGTWLKADPFTYPLLRRIQAILGYFVAG
jgi:8-oxo-dGTP pyrophosphatase MutT (NUDIX family)